MKRGLWLVFAAAVMVAAWVASCASRSLPAAISIVGVNDITKVHIPLVDGGTTEMLFITSADRSELRVLDLNVNLNPRDFVRAPNPIEPLSIPVLPRPSALAKDVFWVSTGFELDGPYVYARSGADSEISVIANDPGLLFEYCRIELTSSVTVTAIASRFDPPKSISRLYYATWDGSGGNVYEADLGLPGTLQRVGIPGGDHLICVPQDSSLNDGGTGAYPLIPLTPNMSGESVTSILALPIPPSDIWDGGAPWPAGDGGIAVATHKESSAGQARTFILDTDNLKAAPRPLNFPAPVRALFTHERIYDANNVVFQVPTNPDGGFEPLTEGARIFGVLDEASCGALPSCSGVIAVDTLTGKVSFDGTMAPDGGYQQMLPIQVGSGLVTGLILAPNAASPPAGFSQPVLPLMGIVSASTGQVFFFNAADPLQPLNALTTPAGPITDATGVAAAIALFADGGTQLAIATGTGPDPFSIDAGEGAANSETISITYQGALPGLTAVGSNDGGQQRSLDLPSGASGVAVGDLVVFNAPNADGGCAEMVPITTVYSGETAIALDGGVPTDCGGWTSFTVLANNAAAGPFLVNGSVSGFLGRLGVGQCLTVQGTVYWHAAPPPDGGFAIPSPTDQKPALSFCMQPGLDSTLPQGAIYEFQLASNFASLFMTVDPRLGPGLQFPGAVAFDGVLSPQTAYVAYPGGNAVLEFPPSFIIPNLPNSQYLQPYR